MRLIGIKHDILFQFIDIFSKKNFELIRSTGVDVIEINCHFNKDVNKLVSILPYIKNFKRISIHLPNDFIYGNDKTTFKLLQKIEIFYRLSGSELAVVHPANIKNVGIFEKFSINWGVENMDITKNSYKSPKEFKDFFSVNCNWVLVLDVCHCYSIDKTLGLVDRFIDYFPEKIKEIHLSGCNGNKHVPIYVTKQDMIISVCKKIDVPIIIESVINKSLGFEDLVKECFYIKSQIMK